MPSIEGQKVKLRGGGREKENPVHRLCAKDQGSKQYGYLMVAGENRGKYNTTIVLDMLLVLNTRSYELFYTQLFTFNLFLYVSNA